MNRLHYFFVVVLCVAVCMPVWAHQSVSASSQERKTGWKKMLPHHLKRPTPKHEITFIEAYMEQPVDHFNAMSHGSFPVRYLFNDDFYKGDSSPILFYCGNEAPIETFWASTGLVHDLAAPLQAAVVFAEHRYFGKSFPSPGPNLKAAPGMGFNAVEQVLEDFVTLITSLKATRYSSSSPVIAFGGSYGGMLAAYLRYKYPHIVAGALAGSAPIWQYNEAIVSPFWFMKRVTDTFSNSGGTKNLSCSAAVKKGLSSILEVSTSKPHIPDPVGDNMGVDEAEANVRRQLSVRGAASTEQLTSALKLCKAPATESDLVQLVEWLKSAFIALAMVDYPYAADFFFGPHPAHPVKRFCQTLEASLEGKQVGGGPLGRQSNSLRVDIARGFGDQSLSLETVKLWESLRSATDVAGLTVASKCLDPAVSGEEPEDDPYNAWGYLACTSQAMPIATNGVSDMFPPMAFNYTAYSDDCWQQFEVRPDWKWGDRFLGSKFFKCSNILFSNGQLDPWASGAPQTSLAPTCPVLWLKDGAHHYDLRGSNSDDTQEVKKVRSVEGLIIKKWISEHNSAEGVISEMQRVPIEPEGSPSSGPIIYDA